MKRKIATVDLGSNTFQILIAEINQNQEISIIKEISIPVKLYFNQDVDQTISEIAFLRTKNATEKIVDLIKNTGNINELYVVATAAFRDLKNGSSLAQIIKNKFETLNFEKFSFEIIKGEKEATLIANAQNFGKINPEIPQLIVDIGGGSVEFILFENSNISWTKSLYIGVAKLVKDFSITFDTPLIHTQNLKKLEAFLNKQFDFLKPLLPKEACNFVGISGAFETDAHLIYNKKIKLPAIITTNKFETLHQNLLESTQNDRINNHLIPEIRKDMLLIANIIIYNLLEKIKFNAIYCSKFDLKYGLLFSKLQ